MAPLQIQGKGPIRLTDLVQAIAISFSELRTSRENLLKYTGTVNVNSQLAYNRSLFSDFNYSVTPGKTPANAFVLKMQTTARFLTFDSERRIPQLLENDGYQAAAMFKNLAQLHFDMTAPLCHFRSEANYRQLATQLRTSQPLASGF